MSKPKKNLLDRKALKDSYANVITSYMNIFCQKHEFDIDDVYWIAGKIGEICEIGDYYFSFNDIKTDIDLVVPKGKGSILDWYDYTLEAAMRGIKETISYEPWLKGARIDKKIIEGPLVLIEKTEHDNYIITIGETLEQQVMHITEEELRKLKFKINEYAV